MRLRGAYDTAKPHLESRDAFLRVLEAPREPVADVAEPPAADVAASPVPTPMPLEIAAPRDVAEPCPDTPDEDELHADAPEEDEQDAPGEDDEDEPEAPGEDDGEPEPDAPSAATADMLIAAGAHVAAAEELDRLFAASAGEVHGPVPPVATAIRLILTLHAENALDAAASLHASLAKWLAASGQEARVIRGDVAARWTLVRELSSLPRGFPAALRGPIARAILDGDLGRAKGELDAFRLRKASVARGWASSLRTSAPVLAAALAPVLDPPIAVPNPPAPSRGDGGGWRGSWAVVAAILALVRLLASSSSSSSSSTPSPAYDPSRYEIPSRYRPLDIPRTLRYDGGFALPRTPGSAFKAALVAQVESARIHAWYMQGYDGGSSRIDYTKVAADVDALDAAVQRDDCKAAGAAMASLKGRIVAGGGAAADDAGWNEVLHVEAAFAAYCPAQAAPRTAATTSAGTRRAGGDAGAQGPRDAGPRGGTDHP